MGTQHRATVEWTYMITVQKGGFKLGEKTIFASECAYVYLVIERR